jgi:hypothetical protein
VIFVVIVFSVVAIVHSSSLNFRAFALVDECTSNGKIAGVTISLCCHNGTDDKGNTKKYCKLCAGEFDSPTPQHAVHTMSRALH